MSDLPEKKPGNPAWTKGGPSPNPAGRPVGVPSIAGEVKEGLIKVFQSVGGEQRVIKLIREKAGSSKKDAAQRDQRFWSFLRDILLPLLPKKTEFDVEKRVVVFEFGDGKSERFERENDPDNVFDVEPVEDGQVETDKSGEGSPDPERIG